MSTIFVIGSSNTDMVIQSAHHPKPGETILGNNFIINPGGKGANQAVAAARLGGQVTFVAKVGDDLFGHQAIQHFQNEGIHTEFVTFESNQPSGVALITVDAKGENTIVVAPGANLFLLKKEIETVANAFQVGDFALFQLEIPIETVQYGIKTASAKGVKCVLNPAPAQVLPDELLHGLFAITPNETEAQILTGIEVKDLASAEKAASILLAKGVQHVVITLGAEGALYCTATQSFQVKAPKVQAVDTTAAGDCFNGALVIALSEGRDWNAAIEFACTAASKSVQKLGAQASMPHKSDFI